MNVPHPWCRGETKPLFRLLTVVARCKVKDLPCTESQRKAREHCRLIRVASLRMQRADAGSHDKTYMGTAQDPCRFVGDVSLTVQRQCSGDRLCAAVDIAYPRLHIN